MTGALALPEIFNHERASPVTTPAPAAPPLLEVEAVTRRGLSHERNEDAYLVDMNRRIFLVSDGMGGHRDGYLASRSIAQAVAQTQERWPNELENKLAVIRQSLEAANHALFEPYRNGDAADISGATAICLLIDGWYACCLWAGDSRLYLLRDEHLFMVSEDHANADGALLRAIGSDATLNLERRVLSLCEGDALVLCSDGLIKGIDETEMADMIANGHSGLADRLLAKAVAGGSTDDITLIVVRVATDEK